LGLQERLDQSLTPQPRPLPRSLGMIAVLFLTLSVTTPASSVFVIIPGMLQTAGSGALWAMLIAAVVLIATAFIYAELSSAWPIAGGEYVMVARTMGPAAGFAILGVSVVNNVLFPPVAGLGISAVLSSIIPGLPQIPVAIAVVAAATLCGLLNIRVNAWITGIFLAIELIALAVVAALVFAGPMRPLSGLLLNPQMPGPVGLVPATPAAIGLATTIAIFALNGCGTAVYFAEELQEAPRQVARAVLWGLVLTLLSEGLPLLAVLVGAPNLPALFAADDPFGSFVALRGGSLIANFVAIGVAIAILNAAIAFLLACARFFYSTARDCSWGRPLDVWLCALHPRHGSPWLATLFCGGIGIAACFLPLTLLLLLSGAGLIAVYGGIALAAIVGRRSGATAHAHYRMPFHPIAPFVTLAALAYVVVLNWQDAEEGRISLIVTGAQILISLGYYYLVLRRRGWSVRDPIQASAGGTR
jgi:amino acid transporter